MRLVAMALSLAVLTGGNAMFPKDAFAGANCTCRYAGGKIQEGQTACIKTPKGMTMARCERVLNNTSWKMLAVPCPYSQLEPTLTDSMSIASIEQSAIQVETTK